VPKTDTVDLDISIDEALRFAISGGVIVPPSQVIHGQPLEVESQPGLIEESTAVVEQDEPDADDAPSSS